MFESRLQYYAFSTGFIEVSPNLDVDIWQRGSGSHVATLSLSGDMNRISI
jgi:hypothetical protein